MPTYSLLESKPPIPEMMGFSAPNIPAILSSISVGGLGPFPPPESIKSLSKSVTNKNDYHSREHVANLV